MAFPRQCCVHLQHFRCWALLKRAQAKACAVFRFCISTPTWVTISSLIVHNVFAETSRLFRYCITYQAENAGQITVCASSLPFVHALCPLAFCQKPFMQYTRQALYTSCYSSCAPAPGEIEAGYWQVVSELNVACHNRPRPAQQQPCRQAK